MNFYLSIDKVIRNDILVRLVAQITVTSTIKVTLGEPESRHRGNPEKLLSSFPPTSSEHGAIDDHAFCFG
jgi:hypothetical protein